MNHEPTYGLLAVNHMDACKYITIVVSQIIFQCNAPLVFQAFLMKSLEKRNSRTQEETMKWEGRPRTMIMKFTNLSRFCSEY